MFEGMSKQDWLFLRSLLLDKIQDVEEWANVGGEQAIPAQDKIKNLNRMKSSLEEIIRSC